MKISRRDTIIIACLMNVSLLAVLFATSSKIDDAPQLTLQSTQEPKTEQVEVAALPEIRKKAPVDEIDQVLQEYALKQKVIAAPKEEVQEPVTKKIVKKATKKAEAVAESQFYIIKNGDNPWKIAKKFGLKYEDLLRLNNLNEESAKNLKIGQKIKIR